MHSLRLFARRTLIPRSTTWCRQISGVDLERPATAIAQSLLQVDPKLRASYAVRIAASSDSSYFKRVDVVEQILEMMLTEGSFGFDDAGLVLDSDLLRLLTTSESSTCSRIIRRLLSTLNPEDVTPEKLNILVHLCKTQVQLSMSVVENFMKYEDAFISCLKMVNAPTPLFGLLNIFRYRISQLYMVSPRFVAAVMDQLYVLTREQLLLSHPGVYEDVLMGSRACTMLGVRHEPFLLAMKDQIEELGGSVLGRARIRDLCNIAMLFSDAYIPCKPLFGRIAPLLVTADENEKKLNSGGKSWILYFQLIWAYEVQQIAPPLYLVDRFSASLSTHLSETGGGDLTVRDATLDRFIQVKSVLPPDIPADEIIRRSIPTEFSIPLRIAAQVQVYHPHMHLGVVRPEGFVALAALIEPHTGEVLPWPSEISPLDVSRETVAGLPGIPVAYLIERSYSFLAEPKGAAVGTLAFKCRLLRTNGWAVSAKDCSDLSEDISRGVDYVTLCVEAIIQAAASQRSGMSDG